MAAYPAPPSPSAPTGQVREPADNGAAMFHDVVNRPMPRFLAGIGTSMDGGSTPSNTLIQYG